MLTKQNRRRLAWVVGFVALLLVVLITAEAIERHTLQRRLDAFHQRVQRIHEGMAESAVRDVAGPPDEFQTELQPAGDPWSGTRECREANGTAAMMYSVDHAGWISDKLGLTPGISTYVVCLDERRRVVEVYVQVVQF